MGRIKLQPQNFNQNWPRLSQAYSPQVSWAQLLWSAITVGKRNHPHLVSYGIHSSLQILSKLAAISAYVEEVDSRFYRTDAFTELDKTEKSAFDFLFGMSMAKWFAAEFLDTPWMMHLSSARNAGLAVTSSSNQSPDLIGETLSSQWVVVEAKGRVSTPSNAERSNAKNQAQSVVSIQGNPPMIAVSVFGVIPMDKPIWVEAHDPPPHRHGISIDLNESDFLREYYRPFVEVAMDFDDEPPATLGVQGFVGGDFPGIGVFLPQRFVALWHRGTRLDVRSILATFPEETDLGVLSPEPQTRIRAVAGRGIVEDRGSHFEPYYGSDAILIVPKI